MGFSPRGNVLPNRSTTESGPGPLKPCAEPGNPRGQLAPHRVKIVLLQFCPAHAPSNQAAPSQTASAPPDPGLRCGVRTVAASVAAVCICAWARALTSRWTLEIAASGRLESIKGTRGLGRLGLVVSQVRKSGPGAPSTRPRINENALQMRKPQVINLGLSLIGYPWCWTPPEKLNAY